MEKSIFFILLMSAATLIGISVFSYQRAPQAVVATTQSDETAVLSAETVPVMQSQGGVEVEVVDIEQVAQTTIVRLVLNNHQYNLGKDAIYEQATLNGEPSLSHTFASNASGGHHVQVDVIFKETVEGSLEIQPVEGMVFTFEDIWEL